MSALVPGASAQTLKIESQGQAEQEAQKAAAIARTMQHAVGEPAAGMGQLVFYRSPKSPGAPIALVIDGASAGNLDAGMYMAVPLAPGIHRYGPGPMPVTVEAGETRYVRVSRNRAGDPWLPDQVPGEHAPGQVARDQAPDPAAVRRRAIVRWRAMLQECRSCWSRRSRTRACPP